VLVQLVDPVEHTYLRSATIERPMADIFTLQDDLAEAVATFLRERIGDQLALERARARAPSPEAWLLARGVEALAEPYWRARGRVPIQRGASARATLERADSMAVLLAAREPAWDEGHRLRGMIAIAWERLLAAEEPEVARAHLTAGLAALDVATALEPNRSESWEAIGLLRWRAAIDHHVEEEASGEVERAEDALRRAVRLDEANAGAWAALSLVRQYRGDTSEATQFARRALEEDAFLAAAADVRHRLMIASLDARDFPDADHWCAEGRARHPGDHRFLTCLLTLPGGAGYRVPASTAADSLHAWIAARDPAEPGDGSRDYRFAFRRMMLAEIHARNGDSRGARVHRDSAWAAVRPHEHLRGPFAWDDAALALLLGDTVASVEALAEWARRNPRLLPYLRESWVFEPLESHPAVIEILGGEAATRRP
jgi:tetratricopeptide (TPR) repeat protein